MIVLLVYCAVVTPFETAFVKFEPPSNSPMAVINLIVDLSFVLDLCMNCRTGYFDMDHGMWIIDHHMIMDRYVRSW